MNKAPASLNPDALAEQVEKAYGCKVIAVLPHSDEMMELASRGLFSLEQPSHPISEELRHVTAEIQ